MSYSKQKSKTYLNNKRTLSATSQDLIDSFQIQNQAINKGPWTEKEDKLLRKWVEENGPYNWIKCSEFVKGRSGKQCREHWNNALDPNLTKGQWTSEEDLLIMIFYKKYGGSWKRIIPIFEKRTENSIKNRFFSQLRKIATKSQQIGKKEYNTNFGLDTLKKFLGQGTEIAKRKFLEEKKMKENELEDYINRIDFLVKNRTKGNKFIDISLARENKKRINNKIINIKEDKEENDYEKDTDLETVNYKRKRRTRQKIEYSKKKDKEDDKNKRQINIKKKKTLDENSNNNVINYTKKNDDNIDDNSNNINKNFKKKNSKKKNIFNNEKNNDETKMINNNNANNDTDKKINQNNNNNNNNEIKEKNNSNNNYEKLVKDDKLIPKDYETFKVKRDTKNIEEDADSKFSFHLQEQIINNDNAFIEQYKSMNRPYLNYNSNHIYNDIKKGFNYIPIQSFDDINKRYYNKKSCKFIEKVEKNSSKNVRNTNTILTRNYCSKNSISIFDIANDIKLNNSLLSKDLFPAPSRIFDN